MNNKDFDRFAEFMTRMIEKYGNDIDLEKYPDPERPTETESVGLLLCFILIKKAIQKNYRELKYKCGKFGQAKHERR